MQFRLRKPGLEALMILKSNEISLYTMRMACTQREQDQRQCEGDGFG